MSVAAPSLALNPVVRRVLLTHLLASVALSTPWPLLLALAWEQTHDPLTLAVTAAARLLPGFLLGWAAGRLADRRHRATLLRWSLLARVPLFLLAWGLLVGGHGLAAALVVTLAALAATPAYPALAAAMPRIAGPATARATALLVTIEVGAFVIGPALGGLLLADALRAWTLPVTLALTALALLVFGRTDLGHVPSATERGTGQGTTGAFGSALRSAAVVRPILVMCLLNLSYAVVGLALLPFAEQGWRGGSTEFGLATAAMGGGALVGPLLVRGRRPARLRITTGLLAFAGCLALTAPTTEVLAAAPLLALAGGASVVVEAAATEQLQSAVPDRWRGSALGFADSAIIGAVLLGSVGGPFVVGRVSPVRAILGCAVLTLGAVALRSPGLSGPTGEAPSDAVRLAPDPPAR